MNVVELTREELYKRVWQTPLRDLAKELFMSDVGLAKLCKRNGIPTPPQGYHLMSEGYKKERLKTALQPVQAGQILTFKFRQLDSSLGSGELDDPEYQRFEALIASRPDLMPFQRKLIHQSVKNIRSRIKKNRTDERGIVLVPENCYPVRVSPALLDRACEIMTELLALFCTVGAEVREESTPENYVKYRLGIHWLGYDFDFRLEERSKRSPAPPKTPYHNIHYFRAKEYILRPSGILELEIRGPGSNTTARDNKSHIEERLFGLARKVYFRAIEQQKKDAIRKERMAKAVARLEELDEIRRENEYQVAKQKLLAKEACRWQKASKLRSYISEIENCGFDASIKSLKNEAEWWEWISWAKGYIDSIDPIARGEAGEVPIYPEKKEIDSIPSIYLDYDDPLEAEALMKSKKWYW